MLSSLHLEALATVCDAGTFEQAAAELQVTPSALSQRISGLERRLGRVLVRRSRPVTPTADGEIVLRLARQTVLLQAECLEAFADAEGAEQVRVSVALNADTLGTWFQEVLADVAAEGRLVLDLRIEDESRTADLLRAGEVMAAVSIDPQPIQGCTVEPLGLMSYVPAVSPDLVDRLGLGRAHIDDLGRMPMLRFGRDDDIQPAFLMRSGHAEARPPVHHVPSNAEFIAATLCGLGWGAIPLPQVRGPIADGSLIPIQGAGTIEVPLYWHRWRVDSPTLIHLTELVTGAARVHLQRPTNGG
ncbi:ArgP/LysG family DNA-binding transcriptional regulator [Mobilicoccus sp.]|uniref:ArgP/LysG family DNA-binding transcriptional regulator n=1 Tax=Mobilicoccus sp. TaxID=2034349 RepID=UPI00289933BD|nr:ArgP/LysG family DNA-binding transcriptional regulator [Mobilicoccus sp.]